MDFILILYALVLLLNNYVPVDTEIIRENDEVSSPASTTASEDFQCETGECGAREPLFTMWVKVICKDSTGTLDSKPLHHFIGNSLDEEVGDFCSEHGMLSKSCEKLSDLAQKEMVRMMNSLNNNNNSKTWDGVERIRDAYENEVNANSSKLTFNSDGDINSYYADAYTIPQLPDGISSRRFGILHSCLFPGQHFSILADMLNTMRVSGLLDGAGSLDALWVLHYGEEINIAELRTVLSAREGHESDYSALCGPSGRGCAADRVQSYGKVHLAHVSSNTGRFENPSMYTLKRLCDTLLQPFPDAQVLYMHTKGASWVQVPLSIQTWREAMMYYLVECHLSCHTLMRDGDTDVIGLSVRLNLLYNSTPNVMGNFWWASAAYVRSLAPYAGISKHDPEVYILSGDKPRVYMPFDHVALGLEPISRSEYAWPW